MKLPQMILNRISQLANEVDGLRHEIDKWRPAAEVLSEKQRYELINGHAMKTREIKEWCEALTEAFEEEDE